MAIQNWSLFLGFGVKAKPCFGHITGATFQDGVIANFQFLRLGSYRKTVNQSLQASTANVD